jgi:hypothetical protein
MINDDLLKYIDTQKSRGVTRDVIFKKLSDVGWKTEDINENLDKAFFTPALKPVTVDQAPLTPNLMPKVVGPAGAVPIKKFEPTINLSSNQQPTIDTRSNSFDNFRPAQKVEPTVRAEVMSPGPLPQGAVISSYRKDYQNLETVNGEPKKHWGALIFTIIFVLLLACTGVIFASIKGYISLPFEIPFLKPTPEQAMMKMFKSLSSTNTLHQTTDLEISVTVEELDSMNDSQETDTTLGLDANTLSDKKVAMTNKVKIKTDMDVDFTNPDSINMAAVTSANLSILGGFSLNLDSEFRLINKVFYIKIPDIGMINEFAGEPNSWLSFSPEDLKELSKEETTVPYDEAKMSKVKDLINETEFIESITEVGQETVEGEATRHYQILINKGSIKNFVSKLIDISDEPELNLQKTEILTQLDSIDEIKADVWVVKGSYAPKKLTFVLSSKDIMIKDTMKVKGKITINSVISKINEKVTIDVPEVSRSMMENIKSAKLKAQDAKIKANISGVRAEAEIFFDEHKNSYGKANPSGSCINPVKDSVFSSSTSIPTLMEAAGSKAVCYSTPKAWAVSAPLATDPTSMWCMDNLSSGMQTKIPLTGTVCK